MYAAVHARPDGTSTVARLARTASRYGYEGLVVRNHGDERADYDPEAVAEEYDVDVVPGIEVRADDPSQASGYVGSHRPHTVVLSVHGGTTPMNRFAVEQPAVDVLAHPTAAGGDFDDVLARKAAANGVRVEFSFGDVLRSAGGERVRRLQDLRRIREIVEHYDVPFVVSTDPHGHLELRAPRELIALGEQLGFSADAVRNGLREWGNIATENRKRLDDDFVETGVWHVDRE